MSKDPAFLFYSSDFLTGTILMNNEQIGMYIKLLCVMHQKGRLSKEDMINICTRYDDAVFKKFEIDTHGLFYNERLELETEKRRKYSESRRNNRVKGHKKNISKSYDDTHDNHMSPHMENENEDENISVNIDVNENENIVQILGFDEFWDLYDKKINRDRCEKQWNKLSLQQKLDVMEYIPKYITAQPDKQYRKHPSTFLNQKSWNDEIIEANNGNKKGPKKWNFTEEHLRVKSS